MPSPLAQKLAGMKEAAAYRSDALASQVVEVCEGLLALIDQNRGDLTEAYEAQIRLDERIGELEKRLPPYQGPRA